MIPSGERGGRAGQGLDGDGPGGFLRGTTQHVFFVPTKRDKQNSNHQFLFQLIGSGVWTMCQRSLILCSSLGLCIGPAVLTQFGWFLHRNAWICHASVEQHGNSCIWWARKHAVIHFAVPTYFPTIKSWVIDVPSIVIVNQMDLTQPFAFTFNMFIYLTMHFIIVNHQVRKMFGHSISHVPSGYLT